MSKTQLIKEIKNTCSPDKILFCTVYVEVLRFLKSKGMTTDEARSATGAKTSFEVIKYLKNVK